MKRSFLVAGTCTFDKQPTREITSRFLGNQVTALLRGNPVKGGNEQTRDGHLSPHGSLLRHHEAAVRDQNVQLCRNSSKALVRGLCVTVWWEVPLLCARFSVKNPRWTAGSCPARF